MVFIFIAFGMIWFAGHLRSESFLRIIAGFVTVTAGIARIAEDPTDWTFIITGVAVICFGLYILITTGTDLMNRG